MSGISSNYVDTQSSSTVSVKQYFAPALTLLTLGFVAYYVLIFGYGPRPVMKFETVQIELVATGGIVQTEVRSYLTFNDMTAPFTSVTVQQVRLGNGRWSDCHGDCGWTYNEWHNRL